MKKILSIFILLFLLSAFVLPVFVFAADTTKAKEPPMQCWPQDACKKKSGIWTQTALSKKECPDFEKKPTAYCYTPPPVVNLQIYVGTTKQVKGLTDYIPKIYDYLVAIVSIVAIVMIMIGGLQYLTAGGSSEQVGKAKERILGAIIGLLLVLGSYILLNTINPALTKLELPPIKMIRTALLSEEAVEFCQSGRGSKKSGQGCTMTCDCEQGSCIGVEKGSAQIISEIGVLVAAAGVSLIGLGGGAAATGASTAITGGKWIIRGSYTALTSIAKKAGAYVLKHPIKTTKGVVTGAAAYGGYMVLDALGIIGGGSVSEGMKKVDNGICVIVANRNVRPGEWCAIDSNCISGQCVVNEKITSIMGKWEGSEGMGICSGGGPNSACDSDADCNVGNYKDLECIDNSNGTLTKSCTDYKLNSPCNPVKNLCKSGQCLDVFIGTPGVTSFLCKQYTQRIIKKDTTCAVDIDCQTGPSSKWTCVLNKAGDGLCSERIIDHACSSITPACNSPNICAYKSLILGKWITYLNNESVYKYTYSGKDLLPEWESAGKTLGGTLCKYKPLKAPAYW